MVRSFSGRKSSYTAAIEDLEAVIQKEKDNACRTWLQSALSELKAMVAD